MNLNPARMKTVDAVNDLFIALSAPLGNIYIGDSAGNVIAQADTETYPQSQHQWILSNEKYYVLIGNPKSCWNSPAQAFVYDLASLKKACYALTTENILCASLHGDELICLLQDSVIEFNLLKGTIHRDYQLHRLLDRPKLLVVHEERLIFVEKQAVTMIQRDTGHLKSLLAINSKRDRTPHLSLDGSLLSICYFFKPSYPELPEKRLFIFDLETDQAVALKRYPLAPEEPMTFEEGKLVRRGDSGLVLVEDFL